MKKVFFLIVVFLFVPINFNGSGIVIAEDYDQNTSSKSLAESIEEELSAIDFSEIENELSRIGDDEKNLFQSTSFIEKVTNLISGKYSDSSNFLSLVVRFVFDDVIDIIPTIATIIAISILGSFVSSLRSDKGEKSVADIIHFVCYGVVVVLVVKIASECIEMTTKTITEITSQMQSIFPILLTLTVAIGGSTTVSVFQPTIALLCSLTTTIFQSILLPIFIFGLIFSIISNLTKDIKLSKFSSFFSSLFKWIVGIVFTVFSAFISIQGISAGKFDGISYKTAKYTIKNTVPVVGGYLSDGFDLVLASTTLIKNAVGVAGLFSIVCVVVIPIIKIVVFSLALKLTGAILQPLGDDLSSNFVFSLSKSISMLVVMILSSAFMYILSIGMVIMTANYV